MDEMIADLLRHSAISDAPLLTYVQELVVAGEPELALIAMLESDTAPIAPAKLDVIAAYCAASEDPRARELRRVVRKVHARRSSDPATNA